MVIVVPVPFRRVLLLAHLNPIRAYRDGLRRNSHGREKHKQTK
jgi:hypothetical protein